MQQREGGFIIDNPQKYCVDGEIGRFNFTTHHLISESNVPFDTAKDIFRTLRYKEWYRTQGFNELAFSFIVDESYRKAGQKLNRVRREAEGGTPMRTLSWIVESEGDKIAGYVKQKSEQILEESGFTKEGVPKNTENMYGPGTRNGVIDPETVKKAQQRYNDTAWDGPKIEDVQCTKTYVSAKEATNISVDDVGVKKQVEHRQMNEKKELKYVRNTIVHIENANELYYLNAESTTAVLPILVAFLLHNRILNGFLEFFVDGERSLHNAILHKFSWHTSFALVLDWYHLMKKCEMQLSLGLKGKDVRNKVLEEVLQFLWVGDIKGACTVLQNVDPQFVKVSASIERLVDYFERNKNYIPCYALRKELGLRNSSNRGEKANDLIVAERQKHNGMSWSVDGSVSLATVTSLKMNQELHKWFARGTIDFKLVS